MKAVIRIELVGIDDPVVWRRFIMPVHFSFHQLHLVIQAAMGWKDSHLYSFSENGLSDILSITSPYNEETGIDGRTVPATKIMWAMYNSGIFNEPRQTLTYIYDYGDHWEHKLDVENIIHDEGKKADLIDGAGACPPEDCGGIPGFADIKRSIRTGEPSEIHGESWLPWLKGMGYKNFNPAVFDVAKARKAVRRI